ncbi:acyl-CoA N-acyltransferase, partial [Clohesyomyces aquaticus]
ELEACFRLVETTSSADYKASSVGWHPVDKHQEMKEKDMRYILVRDQTPTVPILGFLSFMLSHDDPPFEYRPVLYIYEIHLDESVRGFGLGSQLLDIAEFIAKHGGFSKTMLTVFTSNDRAISLYQRRGYSKDQCSPADKKIRSRFIPADYQIMSKSI